MEFAIGAAGGALPATGYIMGHIIMTIPGGGPSPVAPVAIPFHGGITRRGDIYILILYVTMIGNPKR